MTLTSSSTVRLRVSVDDLALGRFPAVCVKSGKPAETQVEIESSDGGFQPWWLLLILLGPLGILGIAGLWAIGRRPNRVGGLVPVSHHALDQYNGAVTASYRLFAVTIVGIIAGLVLIPVGGGGLTAGVALIVMLLGLASVLVARAVARHKWVDVELDGSGRWAVLIGVHPDFASAVRRRHLEAPLGPGRLP